MKTTRYAMFIYAIEPPTFGFDIEWHDSYLAAQNSDAVWTGYFSPVSTGGQKANIMVFGDKYKQVPNPDYPAVPDAPEFINVHNPTPSNELNITNADAFADCWYGESTELRLSGNPDLKAAKGLNPIAVIQANETGIKTTPPISDGAQVRFDGNGLSQEEVNSIARRFIIYDGEDVTEPIGARPNITLENNGNVDLDPTDSALIESEGGKVWEDNSGILTFQTEASVATAFSMFVEAGALVSWYENDVLQAPNTNTHTFFFTDNTVKKIGVRGEDVSNGHWLSLTSKNLVGTCDLSAMTNAQARIDFSDNPNLTEVILPKTDGVFDQLMGYNSGISTLRLDKLPNLINSNNIQIRLGDCPNLDTDKVVRTLLLVDKGQATGRQFWVNGTTPDLNPELKTILQDNNWTVVE